MTWRGRGARGAPCARSWRSTAALGAHDLDAELDLAGDLDPARRDQTAVALARTSSVDIRYLIWTLDLLDGGDRLIEEMGLEPRLPYWAPPKMHAGDPAAVREPTRASGARPRSCSKP